MLIASIASKKLQKVEKGDVSGINPSHIIPLGEALVALRLAKSLRDLPCDLRLHQLKKFNGKHSATRGLTYAIRVSAQWRLVFREINNTIHDLDYVQYH